MHVHHSLLFWILSEIQVSLSALLLFVLFKKKLARDYSYLVSLLAAQIGVFVVCSPLFLLSSHHIIGDHLAYEIYFFGYWIGFAIQSILWLAVVYCIYRAAMQPLKGLQKIGMLVFRWAAAVSALVTIAMSFAPHSAEYVLIMKAITQLQQTSSILTLCLLLFVTFAIQPMGLSYRSRIFGVTLGMGIVATWNLMFTSWFAGRKDMYDACDIVNALVYLGVAGLWAAYFAMPEPERRIIVLPTTSPFLRWNQISLALGSNPGFVAVGNVAPSAFAGAELEVMRRASVATLQMPHGNRDMSIAV